MEDAQAKCPCCGEKSAASWRCDRCGALIASDDLEIDELLSLTPRGRVYRGWQGEQEVAVKELVFTSAPRPETLDLFSREVERLEQLEHSALPRLARAFWEGEGYDTRLYLVWEFIQGATLEKRLVDHQFDEREARKIALDLLEPISYLHARQPPMLHLDIEPANVIQRPDGGHSLVAPALPRELAEEPAVNAAYGYRAPELVIGDPDERSDLYAAGMTLARLLSRRDVAELYGTDLAVVFRPYVNTSSGFLDFVDGLVARSREGRYRSAVRALKALRALPAPGEEPGRALGAAGPVPSTRLALAEVFQFKRQRASEAKAPAPEPAPSRLVWVQSSRIPGDVTPSGRPWCAELGGRRLGLRPGFDYLVGRGGDADIRVEDGWDGADTVSRRHVMLSVSRAGLTVREMGSANGTTVGQMTLRQSAGAMQVRDPARLVLGRFEIRLYPWRGEEE